MFVGADHHAQVDRRRALAYERAGGSTPPVHLRPGVSLASRRGDQALATRTAVLRLRQIDFGQDRAFREVRGCAEYLTWGRTNDLAPKGNPGPSDVRTNCAATDTED